MNDSSNESRTLNLPLKLACADFTFPLLGHDKVLDLIAALELDGVDSHKSRLIDFWCGSAGQ